MSTLIVIAKAPVPGRVKTRLMPHFSAEEAAELARASLEDTLEAGAAARFERRLAVVEGDLAAAGVAVPAGFDVVAQVGGGLDRRLAAAFQEAAIRDGGPALLVGMDTPQVTAPLLEACVPVDTEDATIGMAEDGGFWVLGFRRPREVDAVRLIVGVPMSVESTGAMQLGRLRRDGLRVRIVPTLRDVDTIRDVELVAAGARGSRFAAAVAGSAALTTVTTLTRSGAL